MTYVKRNLNTASQQTRVSGWSITITVYITYKKASKQWYLKNLLQITSGGSFSFIKENSQHVNF
jgi:hypothetical protein